MFRIRLLAAIVGALLAGLAVATIAGARTDDDDGSREHDYATGVGTFGPGCAQDVPPPRVPFCVSFSYTFRLLAVSRHRGQRAWGYFERRNNQTGGTFFGPVRCLNVHGNAASIGGIVTRPSGPDPATPYIVYVVDNGPPGSPVADLISPFAILPPGDPDLPEMPPDFPNTCPAPASIYGYFPLTSGDITVSDAVRGGDGDDD